MDALYDVSIDEMRHVGHNLAGLGSKLFVVQAIDFRQRVAKCIYAFVRKRLEPLRQTKLPCRCRNTCETVTSSVSPSSIKWLKRPLRSHGNELLRSIGSYSVAQLCPVFFSHSRMLACMSASYVYYEMCVHNVLYYADMPSIYLFTARVFDPVSKKSIFLRHNNAISLRPW